MGEEQKKPEEETKKEEEAAVKTSTGGDVKPKEEVKNAEEESKGSLPPPPQEIILRVYMHCEGCARKVRRCLKGFDGVEDVVTDCKTHKVVVKGEKADPLKVLERVQRKSHRQVELLSPIPKPSSEEPKKTEEKEVAKTEEKKQEELQVIIVVLNVHMHCEACAQEIRRRIQKMKGVESVEPDQKSSQVTVKGSFEPPKLVDFIYKRTGKHAVIVKIEAEKKEEEKPKEEEAAAAAAKEEKKAEEKSGGDGDGNSNSNAKKGEEDIKEKQVGGGDNPEQQAVAPLPSEAAAAVVAGEGEDPKLEMKKNEVFYNYPQNHHIMYPPRFVQQDLYAYPPQIFSDENPNACSIM